MNALVTGGSGFIGGALVRRLLSEGVTVHTFQRSPAEDLRRLGAIVHPGDLQCGDDIRKALTGVDTVFHVAAKVGIWGRWQEFFQINVLGTRNLLAMCRDVGVRRVIYTSTPSVTFCGKPEAGVDERQPYSPKFLSHYSHSKAIAEQEVLAANDSQLATLALRPHLVWGPGDRHLLPRLAKRARQGKLRVPGDGKNRIDCTYIDNAIDAHLLAAEKLDINAACAGRPYFVTNGEPLPILDVINRLLQSQGIPPVSKTVPLPLAYLIAGTVEAIFSVARLKAEPPLTRFVVRELGVEHWFDISAAKKDLGYEPRVNLADGLARLQREAATRG